YERKPRIRCGGRVHLIDRPVSAGMDAFAEPEAADTRARVRPIRHAPERRQIPSSTRTAREPGKPARRILSAAAPASYGTRKKVSCRCSDSNRAYAAAGLRSRGCPTDPTMATQRRWPRTGIGV